MKSGTLQSEATKPIGQVTGVDAVGNVAVGDDGARVGEIVGVDAVGNVAVRDDGARGDCRG